MSAPHSAPRDDTHERWRIHVDGVVQGVGFRPFIFGLASRLSLTGWVLNSSAGVDVEAQGPPVDLAAFREAITAQAPPLARIERLASEMIPILHTETGFAIRHSENGAGFSLISPDVVTCSDCLAEILDPANRRYRYPFTNCTNCGPRYTIIREMPYDRAMTTMRDFAMCLACRAEYGDPLNRRFHAQPNACPDCGPQVALIAHDAALDRLRDLPDDIARTAALLKEGLIVAIRGLGGFHIACDAANQEAVARLRIRKARPHKPFAVMMASIEEVRRCCEIGPDEEALLAAPAGPIVLLYRRPETALAPGLAPDNPMLGVMLPSTPLHHILLRDMSGPLVMTSGNLSDLPIIAENDEAQSALSNIADAFLTHNRPIHQRCDDAVWWVDRFAGERDAVCQPLRRSRGDAPYPVRLVWQAQTDILAVGAEMKNTFCLVRGRDAHLSQHIGEVASLEALDYFKSTLDHLCGLFKVSPGVIAHDLHPGYLTTRLARDLAAERGLPLVAVQHHHAHIAACLAEHGRTGPVIGIALDGTGYGPDGAVWGGEALIAGVRDYERAAYLEYLPLPGGDAAIRRPYRIAWSYLLATQGAIPDLPALAACPVDERRAVIRQIEREVNAPLTSSCGRLFDAVSAMLGVCTEATFEAQAAIGLELAARRAGVESCPPYPFTITEGGVIRIGEMLAAIADDIQGGRGVAEIAASFHRTLAAMFVTAAEQSSQRTGIKTAALSGGSFQNRLLLRLVRESLRERGFEVLTHHLVPCNDGGLSLGQAVVALHR